MKSKFYNERCPECKNSVKKLLEALFGIVEIIWDLGVDCRLDDLKKYQIAWCLGANPHCTTKAQGI
jgi:hypothetical protein